jgi:transposase
MTTEKVEQLELAGGKFASRRQRFARVWNNAESVAAAAKQLGIGIANAYTRANYLRNCGVALKRFPRGPKPKPKPEPIPKLRSEPKPKPRLKPRLRDARFAAIWNGSASFREAAERLGLANRDAYTRAYYLRRRGIELKRFRTGPKPKWNPEPEPKPELPRKPPRDAAWFAAIWNGSVSVREAAAQMGMRPQSARTMAWAYRREGLPLKQFDRAIVNARMIAFVAAWNASTTVEEAANRLGTSCNRARGQARRLRRRGINLNPLTSLVFIHTRQKEEQFVALWNTSRSVSEVAAVWGGRPPTLMHRAFLLRKRGYCLKAMAPGGRKASRSRADGKPDFGGPVAISPGHRNRGNGLGTSEASD